MSEGGFDQHPPAWQKAFLTALAGLGVVGAACVAAGVSRSTVYARRSNDQDFARAWQHALLDAADRAEAEAMRRAIEGDRQPVLHNGKPVFVWRDSAGKIVPEGTDGTSREALTKTVKSDLLLIFLLKALRPERFRDRSDVRVTGPSNDVKASIKQTAKEIHDLGRQRDAQVRAAEERAVKAEKQLAELTLN